MNQAANLFCHGCAHSASGAPFPGQPSGERPCHFCIRNPDREAWQGNFERRTGKRLEAWYDESPPVTVPMDCYHSVDMKRQFDAWMRQREQKGFAAGRIPEGRADA